MFGAQQFCPHDGPLGRGKGEIKWGELQLCLGMAAVGAINGEAGWYRTAELWQAETSPVARETKSDELDLLGPACCAV